MYIRRVAFHQVTVILAVSFILFASPPASPQSHDAGADQAHQHPNQPQPPDHSQHTADHGSFPAREDLTSAYGGRVNFGFAVFATLRPSGM